MTKVLRHVVVMDSLFYGKYVFFMFTSCLFVKFTDKMLQFSSLHKSFNGFFSRSLLA